MTFDPTQNKILLFGGAQNAKMMNDVWQYDGTTWERSNAQGPTARFPGAFLFAPQQNGILLFGGHAVDNRGFKTYGDTWLLQNNTWQRLATDGPSPRDGARAAQNPNSQNILLFGGANVTSTVTYLDDTWIWDGAKWQALQVAAPPARLHHAMVYDAKHNRIVLVGGANKPGTTILQDVWEWDGSAWHCVYMCP